MARFSFLNCVSISLALLGNAATVKAELVELTARGKVVYVSGDPIDSSVVDGADFTFTSTLDPQEPTPWSDSRIRVITTVQSTTKIGDLTVEFGQYQFNILNDTTAWGVPGDQWWWLAAKQVSPIGYWTTEADFISWSDLSVIQDARDPIDFSSWANFPNRSMSFSAYDLIPGGGGVTVTTSIIATLESFQVTPLSSAVPEPTTYGVIAAGVLATLAVIRRSYRNRTYALLEYDLGN